MKFDNPLQHTPEHFRKLNELKLAGEMSQADALFLCEVLTGHVHPKAPKIAKLLLDPKADPYVRDTSKTYMKAYSALRAAHDIDRLSPKLIDIFYGTEGIVFLKKPETTKLLVIWTSIFNNFFIANVALAKLIGHLDCSMLFVKDPTEYRYSHGVKGFGQSAEETGLAIDKMARDQGFDQVFYTAASSAGFAALRTSFDARCDGCLLFSPITDWRADSPLTVSPLMTPEARTAIGTSFLEDLKPRLRDADPGIARTLVYGDKHQRDVEHAEHVADLDTIKTVCLPGVMHNTVLPLIAEGTFVPMIEKLLAGK